MGPTHFISAARSKTKERTNRNLWTEQTHIEKAIRRLDVKITPWKKQKAADDSRPLIAAFLEYIRQHGVPSNIKHFIRRLRDDGVLTKTRLGRKWPVSDTTARTILRNAIGVKGQKGRKPVVRTANNFKGLWVTHSAT